jgi:hypothetical protein
MKTIYTFGDSHTGMFCEAYRKPGTFAPTSDPKVVFIDCSSGVPMTAYSFSRYDAEIRKVLASIEFKPQDEMWFILGEIDVRFHIYYHHQRLNISLDESIERVASIYVNYVKGLNELGYNIRIVSVVPPQPNFTCYLYDPSYQIKESIKEGGNSAEDRIYITKRVNERIKAKCLESGVGFIDIYEYLVDPETGCNIPSMTRDGMHYYYIGDIVIEKLGLGDIDAG